jgi:hypothetical protein
MSKFKYLMNQLDIYYPVTLSLLATVGNSLSFIIFSSHNFKKNVSGLFLKTKLVVDTLNVYSTWRYILIGMNGVDIKNLSKFLCILVNTAAYQIDAFSSWLNVLASLDRLALILVPSRYTSLTHKTMKKYQIFAIVATFTLLLLINLIKIFYSDMVYNHEPSSSSSSSWANNQTATLTRGKCIYTNYSLITIKNTLITVAIPFISMIVSSSIIGYNLTRSNSRARGDHARALRRNFSFIETILCLDICFLVFNLPRFILQLLNPSSDLMLLVLTFFTIFKFSYYSLSILIFIATNCLFRRTLMDIFKKRITMRHKNNSNLTDIGKN